jgi:glyoxylase-like metal-dependent hydrolase (beta-lactamase superfamily II)
MRIGCPSPKWLYEPSSHALFGGDLTGNHVTPALIEGNSCGWLTDLTELSARFGAADTVYPGHGDPVRPPNRSASSTTTCSTTANW